MEKDIRGFDLRVDNFKTQIANVINNANLPSSIIFFVLKDILSEVNNLYIKSAQQQYQKFCEDAQQEEEKSSSDDDQID